MEDGLVRGALWLHLASTVGIRPPEEARDPNALLPAAPLAAALEAQGGASGRTEERLRGLAHAYVTLWGRTFRTLVRHLRGRPEHALRLFAEEVYPFLRGARRAARLEERRRGSARLVLQEDLPAAYLAGLAEAFVALSGAETRCEARGHEVFEVSYRIANPDRLARTFAQISAMRVPFLLAAIVAAGVGIAGASAAGAFLPLRAAAVVIGVLAVQAGANALHELRGRREGGPFSAPPLPAWLLWSTAGAGYTGGAAAGVYLIVTGSGWILAWAFIGLGLSLLFALFQDQGYGPFLAGLTYGPLVATGAYHALVGPASAADYLGVALAGLPLGALAAAMVYVNDLADRPLDQAAGRRTLLVRLPRRSHVIGYAALVGSGALGLVAAGWFHTRLAPFAGLLGVAAPVAALALAGVLASALLTRLVGRHVDDPHGLAPARVGTLALHLAAGTALAVLLLESSA